MNIRTESFADLSSLMIIKCKGLTWLIRHCLNLVQSSVAFRSRNSSTSCISRPLGAVPRFLASHRQENAAQRTSGHGWTRPARFSITLIHLKKLFNETISQTLGLRFAKYKEIAKQTLKEGLLCQKIKKNNNRLYPYIR